MIAMFVGRFQPFHKGHEHAVKRLIESFEKVVIAIGSIQESFTLRNPFTFEERKTMIERTLNKYEGRYEIVGVPDFFDDEKWRDECMKRASFDVVVTGSPWTRRCFEGVKKVIEPDWLKPDEYSGTRIREMMIAGRKWEHLVPDPVAQYIKSIGGEDRLRMIAQSKYTRYR